MAKIYLASTYTRIEEIQWYADLLEKAQHEITSVWHKGEHKADDANRKMWTQFGVEDLEGIRKARGFVVFTGAPSSRGGYHSELGYAQALTEQNRDRWVEIVGPIENCIQQTFLQCPRTVHYEAIDIWMEYWKIRR